MSEFLKGQPKGEVIKLTKLSLISFSDRRRAVIANSQGNLPAEQASRGGTYADLRQRRYGKVYGGGK